MEIDIWYIGLMVGLLLMILGLLLLLLLLVEVEGGLVLVMIKGVLRLMVEVVMVCGNGLDIV